MLVVVRVPVAAGVREAEVLVLRVLVVAVVAVVPRVLVVAVVPRVAVVVPVLRVVP